MTNLEKIRQMSASYIEYYIKMRLIYDVFAKKDNMAYFQNIKSFVDWLNEEVNG